MQELLYKLLPNMIDRIPEFLQSIVDTLVMVFWSGSLSFFIGLFFGIVLVVTKTGGILQNRALYQVLDKVINFFRSIPFIILLTAVIFLSRAIMGTGIGVRGAIVPLVFGTVPFFSRQVEGAMAEVDGGLIEAAQSMGLSPLEIIVRVYLKESIPGLARATTITAVSLVGLTAMAGAVGAGGLGDFAIRYGHGRGWTDATVVTVITTVIIVSILQWIGSVIAKKNTH